MSLGSHYWSNRFARWPGRLGERDGYTLLIPVPGDLPVMLEVALAVTRHQRSENRVSTIIVPDRPTKVMKRLHAEARAGWVGDLDYVLLPRPERWMLPVLNNGWRNHGVQLIAGVSAATSSHLILHDADLFMLRDDFLETHFVECRERDLACLGVQPVVWDKFYEEHGRQMAATWELCSSVNWLRAWPPAMMMSHEGWLWEQKHSFDTTLHPQALTEPHRIAISEKPESDFVHFGYVTATYRLWQRRKSSIEDGAFTYLLIRTMIDTFSSVPDQHTFPTADELASGLTDTGARIRYPSRSDGEPAYRRWRERLEQALDGPWTTRTGRDRAMNLLRPFDNLYLGM